MKFFKYLIICISLINSQFLDEKGFYDLIKEFENTPSMTQGELIYFFRIRENRRKDNINYLSEVFKKFLLSLNIRSTVYNWNNHDFIVLTKSDIDIDMILSHFDDLIDKAGVRSTTDFRKKDDM